MPVMIQGVASPYNRNVFDDAPYRARSVTSNECRTNEGCWLNACIVALLSARILPRNVWHSCISCRETVLPVRVGLSKSSTPFIILLSQSGDVDWIQNLIPTCRGITDLIFLELYKESESFMMNPRERLPSRHNSFANFFIYEGYEKGTPGHTDFPVACSLARALD